MTDDQALVNCHVYGAPANDASVMHLRKGAGGDIREYLRASYRRRAIVTGLDAGNPQHSAGRSHPGTADRGPIGHRTWGEFLAENPSWSAA